jgi:hypothetical protein
MIQSSANSPVRVVADAYFGHEDKNWRMVLDLSPEPGKYRLEFVPSDKEKE